MHDVFWKSAEVGRVEEMGKVEKGKEREMKKEGREVDRGEVVSDLSDKGGCNVSNKNKAHSLTIPSVKKFLTECC